MRIDNVGNNCFNCQACVSSCPTDAIEMQYIGGDVFKYPFINNEKCIECGKCAAVCPAINSDDSQYEIKKCFYGQHKDDEIRKKSSSGGAFRAVADSVLEKNGVVFSAYMDYDDMTVKFGSTRELPIEAFMKSKYVESYIGDSFKKIKAELQSGALVLFCGTPCQVQGLNLYLKKDYDNLITVDFICHGVPSQKFFKEHCDYLENKYKSKITHFDFRPKTLGWTPQCLDVHFENRKKLDIAFINDSYFYGFMSKNIYLRLCCYSCPFSDNHKSDITIADFWGHKKSGLNVINDEKGMSLILCNSKSGSNVINSIADTFSLNEISSDVADYTVKKRVQNNELLKKRENFINLSNSVGFERAAENTYMLSKFNSFLRKIKFKMKLIKKQING